MEARQIERRAERARMGGYEIRNLLEEPVHSRFEVLSPSGARYEVEIRDPRSRNNGCTCPDYESNLLGTCKHVEAVLLHLRRRLRRPARALLRQPSPRPWVFLAYGSDVCIRLVRPARMDEETAALLDRFFDADGRLKGDPVQALPELEAAARPLPVLVSEEARRWVASLEERRRADREAVVLEAAAAAGEAGPPLLRVPLYPYQVRGTFHLALAGRAVLGDEMGLGKTVQALAACEWLRRNRDVRRVLVVCPTSLKHQWAREAERLLGAPTTVVQGPRHQRRPLYRSDAFLTVVNYELVRHDLDVFTDDAARFDVVILDEAQRIKNWRARTSEAIKRLRPLAPRAFVLSGTPLVNNLDELYSVLQFVDPRLLGPLWSFNERYYSFDADGRMLGVRNLDELRRRIAPVFLRRTKEEVHLQLPGTTENTYFVELTPEQRRRHDEHQEEVARILAILRRRPLSPKEQDRLLRHLAMMRMVCDSPFILDREVRDCPKLDELVPILEELAVGEGRKVIVFSEWERMTQLVAERLEERKIGFARLHGGVPSGRRGGLLDRFTRDPTCRVLLSTDAGGLGLNLQEASVVVHLDLPWNPARYDQRVGRALRIGQRRTVQVVRLVARHSIEERMLDTLARKRVLFDSVVGRDGPAEIAFPSKRETQLALLSTLVDGDGAAAAEAPLGESASPPAETVAVPERNLDAVRERLASALPGVFEGLERISDDSSVAVVSGDLEAARRAAAAVAPAVAVLDRRSYEILKPALSGRPAGGPPRADAADEDPRRQSVERAREKLGAASCLLDGGFAAEAVRRAAEAAEEAVRALLWGPEAPPRGVALVGAAYAAARKGVVPGALLAQWAFVRDLNAVADSAGGLDADVARDAVAAARALSDAAGAPGSKPSFAPMPTGAR